MKRTAYVFALASLMYGALADHSNSNKNMPNSGTISNIAVGTPTQGTTDKITVMEDYSIDLKYASVRDLIHGDEYIYFITTLHMPKIEGLDSFLPVQYVQIISSEITDPNDFKALTGYSYETVACTIPVFSDETVGSQLAWIKQFHGEQFLYDQTGNWQLQMIDDLVVIDEKEEILWGWDSTESHSTMTTKTVVVSDSTNDDETSNESQDQNGQPASPDESSTEVSDTPVVSNDPPEAEEETGQTTIEQEYYNFQCAMYRKFNNPLSEGVLKEIKFGNPLYFKLGFKVFDLNTQNIEYAKGISEFTDFNVLAKASLLSATLITFTTFALAMLI